MADGSEAPVPPVPWTRVLDDGTGCYYYFNTRTGDSVWETPAVVEVVLAGLEPNASPGVPAAPPAPSPPQDPSIDDVVDAVAADFEAVGVTSGGDDDDDDNAPEPHGFLGHRSSVAFVVGADGKLVPRAAAKQSSPERDAAEELPEGESKRGDGEFGTLVQANRVPPPVVTAPSSPKKIGLIGRIMSKLKGGGKASPIPGTPPTASSMQAHVQFSPVAAGVCPCECVCVGGLIVHRRGLHLFVVVALFL